MKRFAVGWPAPVPQPTPQAVQPLWRRLLWMLGIWAASSAAVLCVAALLGWVLRH